MIAYPGSGANVYFDITRNGEPVVPETQPTVVALIRNGANLLGTTVSMTNLDTGLYVATVPVPSGAPQGTYMVVIEYRWLGKDRRETQSVDVVNDVVSVLVPLINSVKDFVEALLPQNTRYEFIRALSDIPARNVSAGRLDRIHFTHKHTEDDDYTTPVAEGERMFVYDTIGDINPTIVEGL